MVKKANREDRTKGFFIPFDYSSDALTVREILDEQIAKKLA